MAALSLFLTVLSAFTFWLVIPLFLLPPLAFFFGYKSYKRKAPQRGLARLLSLVPMVLAVAAFVLELTVMNTEYRV